MVTDVIDVSADFTIARQALWDVLLDPQSYPRMFTGIGACERIDHPDGAVVWQVRVGSVDTGIHTHEFVLGIGRWYESFELRSPALGSFASVRLRGDQQRTRLDITLFAAARVHPMLEQRSNSVVTDWVKAGLRRTADVIAGTRSSVVVNAERSPLRRNAGVARSIAATGLMRPEPVSILKQLRSLSKWGFNLAGGYAAGAAHSPDRVAVLDRFGTRTYREIDTRSDALAGAMYELGMRAGDAIGLLARNHAGMVETMVAAGKLGVDVALLNAGLSGRRIEEIVQRHRLSAVFVDGELETLIRYLHSEIPRFTTDADPPDPQRATIDGLIAAGVEDFPVPAHPGRLIVLTSGTSGSPKGARRPHAKGFGTIAALLSRIPLRVEEVVLVPAPLFHTWGLAGLQLSTALRATVVLTDGFDAVECLRSIGEHRITTLIVVPTMVERLLDVPDDVRASFDLSSLRHVVSCGAPLAGATVLRFLDTYGDVLYNVYGSTEVSWASVATPADLRVSPTTAGRPPLGTRVGVLGPDLRPVPVGAVGHIFVANHMLFDGYVNAAPPEEADGMLDTGDLGYLDASGRLFVAGRDDEMIISGGENVFPRPVEEALAHLPQITEVAVVGVPDREFGQRLAAFVVKREGAGLDPDMIRTYIRHRLSRFSVPRDVTFINALPRGETGKILKWMLVRPEQALSE
ncbi:AMP-binding protein [Nocardia ignorata]|uniref:Acyl-CoA synthetase (AMP-forming)/AMP-acid ligase II n=1 Tax=Nocardia ignorata TaxID=145285 RepID=A0A4R6PMA9_NOCIG|nr:AMP-binding protein [Nocardia ignorata]TDP37919.1 acyl-CoA synthetase (AMP-forming)/AMP-acid ligase II [Nocardia ignorata]